MMWVSPFLLFIARGFTVVRSHARPLAEAGKQNESHFVPFGHELEKVIASTGKQNGSHFVPLSSTEVMVKGPPPSSRSKGQTVLDRPILSLV